MFTSLEDRLQFVKMKTSIHVALQGAASASVRHKSSRYFTVSSANERNNADNVAVKQDRCFAENYVHS